MTFVTACRCNTQTYTVAQFCADHNISRTHFYQLTKDGKGPRLMKLGRRVLISAEAAADWRRQMEAGIITVDDVMPLV